ncbi:response regulator transcription factor [Paenibacillus pasadenensis]|uniref:Phosphate regulon transcriptional regulatory protein PhoB (SphR) n=1 Tax=Paenibacillus pasadenensis TaxID=217090 RepID=A0A2N5N6J7_9BACL|nr:MULTISPECIES: response regulator transcription factor [Paenibacillus]PLT45987.1 Phosphate regulon transcriptional regulatory protein PhoB (SphR) [Paenibacillus pasadenensis]QGG56482.1 response regulator [Paenibacillus sp. B01]
MDMKVVWIEDERELLEEGARFLRQEGWEVEGAASAEEAEALIERGRPDLLLVDWMLEGGRTGLDLCRLNDRSWQLPLLMVTARGDEFDRVLALELGADDFIQKPFSLRELHARMKAVLRRAGRTATASGADVQEPGGEGEVLERGELTIRPLSHEAELEGRALELTRTEFALLLRLASRPGRVFTRTHLLEEALGDAFAGYERTIDSHIRNLRRKLGDDPADPRFVLTVYGVGYKFNPDAGAGR